MNDHPESPMHLLVDQFLDATSLPTGDAQLCPYLPDRIALNEGFTADNVPPEMYLALMDRGFRRSGRTFYRPVCEGCRRCQQLRIPTDDFKPSRSQRRVYRTNQDVTVKMDPHPTPTDAKWRLFKSYVDHQHDPAMPTDRDAFDRFLYDSPIDSLEITYELGHQTIGISLADRSPTSLSTVYMYFDPAYRRRSLGTFSILWEIEYCRRERIPYYYLGFYVSGSRNMAYKARFKPHQLLDSANVWHSTPTPDTPGS